MKAFLHPRISILLACVLPLQPTAGLGQSQNVPSTTRVISKSTVVSEFQKLQQQSKAIQLLDSRLRGLQYAPATGTAHYWGESSTYQQVVSGRSETIVGTVYIRDYVKPNSKDGAAIAQITLTSSSGETQTYPFYLIAPNGDPSKAQEYAVVNNEVTLQHSWWTCVEGQLPSAGSQCSSALITCAAPSLVGGTFSWAVYAACVGATCGIASIKACLCCACNGSFWCSLIVGKCSQGAPAPTPAPVIGGYKPPPALCKANERCCETKDGKCTKCIGANMQCP